MALWTLQVPRLPLAPSVGLYHASRYDVGMTHAVSVRLDEEARQALRALEASGMSRSEAIRKSILDAAAALRRRESLRAEVASLEADKADRREMREVASLMESLRAEG